MAVIAIVTSAPPLIEGGHLVLARALERALLDAGHRAGIVLTPSNRFGRQGPAYLANWLTDVGMTGTGDRVDQVISMRFPSYAVRHPNHTCWLVHTMREYYDLWDRFAKSLSPQGRVKETVRRTLVRAADTYCFKRRVSRLFTISQAVADRLETWNHVTGQVLHPPPPPRPYRCDGYGDYLFFASRLSPLKRADLVVRALAEPAARHVRCVIAGDGEGLGALRDLVRQLGLDGRVTLVGRLDDEALVAQLAGCRAVVFPPREEDYGFVTVEAFASRKAVITCHDSGGPLEFVRDGVTGRVTAPDPPSLAAAMAELSDDAALADRLGGEAQRAIAHLTWAETARRLVSVP